MSEQTLGEVSPSPRCVHIDIGPNRNHVAVRSNLCFTKMFVWVMEHFILSLSESV